jgi:transposase-like protein
VRQFRRLSVPSRAHPLVRHLYEEMNHQQIGILDMSQRSGINKNTINDWKRRSIPQVHNLEACFSVLGLKLTIVKSERG